MFRFNADLMSDKSWTFTEFVEIATAGDITSVPLCLRNVGPFTRINEKRHLLLTIWLYCKAGQVDSFIEISRVPCLVKIPRDAQRGVDMCSGSSQLVTKPPTPMSLKLWISESAQVVRGAPVQLYQVVKGSMDVNQVLWISPCTLLQCLPFAIAVVLIGGPWTTANVTQVHSLKLSSGIRPSFIGC